MLSGIILVNYKKLLIRYWSKNVFLFFSDTYKSRSYLCFLIKKGKLKNSSKYYLAVNVNIVSIYGCTRIAWTMENFLQVMRWYACALTCYNKLMRFYDFTSQLWCALPRKEYKVVLHNKETKKIFHGKTSHVPFFVVGFIFKRCNYYVLGL